MAKRLYSFRLQVLLLVGILSSTQAFVDTVPEPCNSTAMATATNKLFISPGHPGNYSNDAFCDWEFESPEGTTIFIEFTAFNLERGYDFIKVYESDSVQERFTGDLSACSSLPSYTSITNMVRVQFTTDDSYIRTGFSAYFRIADDTPSILSCGFRCATFRIDQNRLDELGVGYNDYLIINDVVEDDVSGSGSGDVDSNCKLLGDNGGGSLSFALDECNPAVENTDTDIIFTWYARNAEQGNVKRKDHCYEITCKYSRDEYLTAPPVAVTLTKLELEEISGSGEIPVKLETFLDFDRENPWRSFNVPEPIYVRAYIDSALPTSFYVQIDSCFASDLTNIEIYTLIVDGVADTSDPEGGVVALVPPGNDYVPLQQDFQFNSFTWTEDDQDNAIVIHCNIYLCDSDEVGLDCATTMLAPVGDGNRRKRMIADDYRRKVSSKPISITKR